MIQPDEALKLIEDRASKDGVFNVIIVRQTSGNFYVYSNSRNDGIEEGVDRELVAAIEKALTPGPIPKKQKSWPSTGPSKLPGSTLEEDDLEDLLG